MVYQQSFLVTLIVFPSARQLCCDDVSRCQVDPLTAMAIASAADDDRRRGDRDKPIPLTVPKAKCGPNDRPETALQGQVPLAMRVAGFNGFNCNLELLGQAKGDGANWQT